MTKLIRILVSCSLICFLQLTSVFSTTSVIYSINTFSTTTCDDRQTEGVFCQTCEIMSTCILLNNEWLTVPVKSCDAANGFYCNMFYGGCSNSTGVCNPVGHEISFMCKTEGIFPNPYDCQKYHLCFRSDGVNLVAINLQCAGNLAFSPQTNECTAYVNSTACSEKQFQCNKPGDQNPWPGNSNIFYICASTNVNGNNVLFPLLFRCPPNQIHDGVRCVVNSGEEETTTISTTDGPIEFVCPSHIGAFPHSTNCRQFYFCIQYSVYTIGTCPTGHYFNASTLACLFGECV